MRSARLCETRAAVGPIPLEDEEYRRRLQDKFGDRWRIKQVVQAKQGEMNTRQADATTTAVETDREVTVRSRRAKRKRTRRTRMAEDFQNDLACRTETELEGDPAAEHSRVLSTRGRGQRLLARSRHQRG